MLNGSLSNCGAVVKFFQMEWPSTPYVSGSSIRLNALSAAMNPTISAAGMT